MNAITKTGAPAHSDAVGPIADAAREGALQRASLFAARIVDALGAPCEIGGITLRIKASVGIALFPEDGGAPEALLRNADLAMYAAKQRARLGALSPDRAPSGLSRRRSLRGSRPAWLWPAPAWPTAGRS